MKLDEKTKLMINELQCYIVPCYESDNVLLIFDNQAELLKYKRSKKYMCPNEILKTMDELFIPGALTGIRYKRYHFV